MSIVKNENTITKAFYGSKPIYMFGSECNKPSYDFTAVGYTDEEGKEVNEFINSVVENGLAQTDGSVFGTIDNYKVGVDLMWITGDVFGPPKLEGCTNLVRIPKINMSGEEYIFSNMIQNCRSLRELYLLNTETINNIQGYSFSGLDNLETLGSFDCSNIGLYSLSFPDSVKLRNVGGFQNYGKSNNANARIELTNCPNLSFQSMQNIVNSVYDYTITQETVDSKVWINSTAASKWGEEIGNPSISSALLDEMAYGLTQKGWTLSVF